MKNFFLLIVSMICFHLLSAQDDKYLLDLRAKLASDTLSDSLRVFTLSRIGAYFSYQDNFDSATYYNNKSLELAKQINLPYGVSSGYNNMGELEYKYERYEKALSYFLKALEVSEKHK